VLVAGNRVVAGKAKSILEKDVNISVNTKETYVIQYPE
jgi:hypothetical protein